MSLLFFSDGPIQLRIFARVKEDTKGHIFQVALLALGPSRYFRERGYFYDPTFLRREDLESCLSDCLILPDNPIALATKEETVPEVQTLLRGHLQGRTRQP